MTNRLVERARYELRLAHLLENPVGVSVVELLERFVTGSDNPETKQVVLDLFTRLARGELLTELTSKLDEWALCPVEEGTEASLWQNVRRETTFSRDGGQTWYDTVDESFNHGDVEHRWQPVLLGEIESGLTTVRVKPRAYEGKYATHNGRTGLVVGVRGGLVSVRYDDDDQDVSMGHQHRPESLERYAEGAPA